ncbi:major capsid protein [Arthrobacter phage KeAlii]|uniref:Major capsid protein n=1 Tax=Arthrobacter phage KeAlii TaxID=2885973 RepID=A0AA95B873_9CAUD|nr:major head protein [Arthrobacter phage KeAlii]UDL14613.1 major capsid protein [Arthrobacter phage KeAlii]
MANSPHTFTATQAAQVAVALASEDAFLSALVNRNFENDLLGGGGKGRTVNVKIPAALIARERGIDEIDAAIVMDTITESTVPVTLGTHAYSAVPLSEGDMTLNIADFSAQVLAPQAAAVVDFCEEEVASLIRGITEWNDPTAPDYDPANPVKTLTAIRKRLRDNGVPQTGLNLVVGTRIYADLLEANAITDASASGSTEALREGNVGRVRGFNVVESTRVDEDDIVAFHRDAITLAVRAPVKPAGAAFGAVVNEKGFSLRYLRDYDVTKTVDRSMLSTFVGAATLPMKRIVRDYTAGTATVVDAPAMLRVNVGTIEV